MSISPRCSALQTPDGDGYRVDAAYDGADSFLTFRTAWKDADVALYLLTREGVQHTVQKLDTSWDTWKLVENAPECGKGAFISKGKPVGVRIAGYEVTRNYHKEPLSEFYKDWSGKGVHLYWSNAGSAYESELVAAPTGSFGDRPIYRNRDDSVVGKIIPDGGDIGVILDAESPAPGPGPQDGGEGLLTGVPNAWELPLGIAVGLVVGVLISLRRRA